ncbi:MAG TPA: UDP-galactopyranose mutase, partial [Rhodothermales bacterium]|nr:UDP-galactopyranose mutase [Rhodothermales bacterium]
MTPSRTTPQTLSPLVVFSHLRWDFVFQRPQHLLTRLAVTRPVLFVEEPEFREGEPGWTFSRPAPGIEVARPHTPVREPGFSAAQQLVLEALVDALLASHHLSGCDAWLYTPLALPLAERLSPIVLVFDAMDELSLFAGADPRLVDLEQQTMTRADVVFTGGPSLYRARKDRHPHVYCFSSSVEAAHFAQALDPGIEADDQRTITGPKLGFFGVVDERMDPALLAALADAHPEWNVVVIGPVVKIDPVTLPQRPNLHYLGARRYEELPRYLAGWDLCLLPFACNDATRFISPTKTLEYFAAEKPVVSTSITDVAEPYGDIVYLADGPADFVAACEQALSATAGERTARTERMRTVLAATSWDRTAAEMARLVEEARMRSAASGDGQTRHATGDGVAQPVAASEIVPEPHVDGLPGRPIASAPYFDYLVVGAGFAGAVMAERLAREGGKRVLVVDRRRHIAGNAYDEYNADGLLIHRYGPHIFHTNAKRVWDYLSAFTEWRPYEHRVLASVDGQLLPIPINLDTINRLYGLNLTSFEVEDFFNRLAEPRAQIRTSEDVVVSRVGTELYRKFFRNYTRKQWDLDPSELDASVISRVPIRTNRDDRYFTDTYQAMPLHGYTRMFERMLEHPRIKVMLGADYREVRDLVPHGEVIFTGPVDEYFDFAFGKLPYRSLEFRHETHAASVFQPAPVVNYPNEHPYTRITEFKYLTGQEHPKTSVVYEY